MSKNVSFSFGDINTDKVINEKLSDLEESVYKALDNTDKDFLEIINNYVPYATGTVSESGIYDSTTDSIVYGTATTDYVDYIYNTEGIDFNEEKHSKATSNWVAVAFEENSDKLLKLIKERIGKI